MILYYILSSHRNWIDRMCVCMLARMTYIVCQKSTNKFSFVDTNLNMQEMLYTHTVISYDVSINDTKMPHRESHLFSWIFGVNLIRFNNCCKYDDLDLNSIEMIFTCQVGVAKTSMPREKVQPKLVYISKFIWYLIERIIHLNQFFVAFSVKKKKKKNQHNEFISMLFCKSKNHWDTKNESKMC